MKGANGEFNLLLYKDLPILKTKGLKTFEGRYLNSKTFNIFFL